MNYNFTKSVLTLIAKPFKNSASHNDNYGKTQPKGLLCSFCSTFGLNLLLLSEIITAVKNANL